MANIFHLAIPVDNIDSTVDFFQEKLGFTVDLIEKSRCIINFANHQVVAHLSPEDTPKELSMYPRHFGLIFDEHSEFDVIYQKAKSAELDFFQELFERFPGTEREHKSFFLADPSNNLLEFKCYKNPSSIMSANI